MTSTAGVVTVDVCAAIAAAKASGDGSTSTIAPFQAHASVGT